MKNGAFGFALSITETHHKPFEVYLVKSLNRSQKKMTILHFFINMVKFL